MTFAPRITYGDLDLTDAPFMVEFGFDLGNGQTVYEALTSLIRDGSIQVESRQENRTITLSVLVEAPDSVGQVTDGASVLASELLADFNTLTFEPGDGFGSACVFETMAAQAEHDWDQDLEQAGLRRYVLTIPALPAIRSVDEVTVNVTTASAYTQLALTTGLWTTVSGGPLSNYTVAGSPIGNADGIGRSSAGSFAIERTVTVDRPWLWALTGVNTSPTVTVNGATVAGRKETFNAGGSTPPFYFTYPLADYIGQSVTLRLTFASSTSGDGLDRLFLIDHPSQSTGINPPRQITRIPVLGSARSPIRISAPGAALIYTAPDPLESLQTGMPEQVFARFTFSGGGGTLAVGDSVSYWPDGTWSRSIGATRVQPPELTSDGVIYSGFNQNGLVLPNPDTDYAATGTVSVSLLFAYPADRDAALSYFPGSDALVISPRPSLPQGYHSQADAHETHSVHPSRSGYMGFAALDSSGNPVAATITYYPRWRHHAGQ